MTYEETSAKQRTERSGMSHLSIEVGHLYADDLARPGALRDEMRSAAAWVGGATEALKQRLRGRTPRVSTCYLVDDYFHHDLPEPEKVIEVVTAAAAEAGLHIDYLARESSCAVMGAVDLAGLVADRIVFEPPPGATGARRPVSELGWLPNGVRTPAPRGIAMGAPWQWTPPSQNARREHSVFLDVELWNETLHGRRWSCPMLAAVWQLLRLGVLRDQGRRIDEPVPVGAIVPNERGHDPADFATGPRFPGSWAEMPPILQLNEQAFPFPAYRSVSVLAADFLEVEHAVRVICSAVRPDAGAVASIRRAAERENLRLPDEIVDRLDYIFQGSL